MKTARTTSQLFSNRKSMGQMLRSVLTGCYRMSMMTTVITFLSLAYIISPLDILSDYVSPYGLVDDVLILLALVKVWSGETHRYIRFKVMERKHRGF